jgi:crossover junction endodeoxyribonuclease RuvC
MIVLGIDAAIRCTGFGVLDAPSLGGMRVIDCGVIRNTDSMPHSECMRRIAGGIRELVRRFSPEFASIENAFYGKNVRTAMILSLARGAAITTLAEGGVTVFEYSPREVKKAIVGWGAASKDQLATILSATLNLDIAGVSRDSTDALAMAVCHAQIALRPELAFLLPKPL